MTLQSTCPEGRIVAFPGTRRDHLELDRIFHEHKLKLVQYLRIRLGSEAEAEDIAQAAFLRLHVRREVLKADNLVSLLYVTARNLATDVLRQRSRSGARTGIEHVANLADDAADAERALIAKQQVRLIERILEELPAKCRASFVAYRFHEKSYCEIAAQLGVTESMVRKYVIRATAYCSKRFHELER